MISVLYACVYVSSIMCELSVYLRLSASKASSNYCCDVHV